MNTDKNLIFPSIPLTSTYIFCGLIEVEKLETGEELQFFHLEYKFEQKSRLETKHRRSSGNASDI